MHLKLKGLKSFHAPAQLRKTRVDFDLSFVFTVQFGLPTGGIAEAAERPTPEVHALFVLISIVSHPHFFKYSKISAHNTFIRHMLNFLGFSFRIFGNSKWKGAI